MMLTNRPVDESSPSSAEASNGEVTSRNSTKRLFGNSDELNEDEKENVSGAQNGARTENDVAAGIPASKSKKRKRGSDDGLKEPDSKRITDYFSLTPKSNSSVSSPVFSNVRSPQKRKSSSQKSVGGGDGVDNEKEAATRLDAVNQHLNSTASPKTSDTKKNKKTEEMNETKENEPDGVDEDNDEVEEEEEEEYEVEIIRDYSYCKSSEQGLYLVKWMGWPDEENTWEPLSNLDCREKLVEFFNRRSEERKAATGQEKRKLELPPDPRDSSDMRDLFLQKYWKPPSQEKLMELLQLKKKNKLPKLVPEPKLWKEMESLAESNKVSDKRLNSIVEQLNIREFEKIRRKQISDLKAWETEINNIDKDVFISVVNDVDLEGPPTVMKYINAYKASEGIEIPDDPPLGCECKECKIGSSCCCPGQAGYDFPYTAAGKLRLNIGFPIYECNKRCNCPPNCKNRVVQKGRTVRLSIFRTDNGCGWGVKTLDRIKEGTFVVQYVGEVITSEEAERRGKDYDAAGRTYLFDLDFNLGDDNPYTVDAAFFGNLSHFMNHSCEPNLNIYNVYINCLDPNLPQLCLFARRDIEKGEQLTFDYCQSTGSLDNEAQESSSPMKTPVNKSTSPTKTPKSPMKSSGKKEFSGKGGLNRTECRCQSNNCRKVLF